MAKDLQSLIKTMQAKYGADAIGLLGNMKNVEVEAITTGLPSVDYAIGVGGVPLGRIVEIYGNEGSGKTSLTLQIISQWQKLGHTCAFIDVEHALDPNRAEQIGVDLNSLLFTQPDSAEEALDMVHDLAATGEVRLIIIDSVTALLPKAEDDADMEQNTIGLQARLLSKAMRKLKGVLAKNKCTAIFINQIREKVGAYGNPETTSGGRALRFYASLRIEVRRGDVLGSKEEPIGHTAKVKIVKNKVASPYKTADFDIYSVGDIAIDPIRSTINLAVELGVMTKGGSWIYYPDKENPLVINGDQCKWQSMQKAIDTIRSNPDIYSAIYNDIMAIARKDNEGFVPEEDNEEGENENE